MILDHDKLRAVIIECLRKERSQFGGSVQQLQVSHLFQEVAEIARERGLEYSLGINAWKLNHDRAEVHPNLRSPIWSIVWDLIIEGVLRPGVELGDTFELPYIHLTKHGKKVIAGAVTPYDPAGYLKELTARVPTIDPIIEKYIAEAAVTLRRNCFLSSTVTLGCASEMAFLLLSDAYSNSLNPTSQTAYDLAVSKTRGIKQHHKVFMTEYENLTTRLKTDKGTDWLTGMNNAMDHVFSYFRDMRNAAGHPSGYTYTKELVASHLMIFPYYLRLIYDLIEWCDTNKPL
jgi:hypothetical protein